MAISHNDLDFRKNFLEKTRRPCKINRSIPLSIAAVAVRERLLSASIVWARMKHNQASQAAIWSSNSLAFLISDVASDLDMTADAPAARASFSTNGSR